MRTCSLFAVIYMFLTYFIIVGGCSSSIDRQDSMFIRFSQIKAGNDPEEKRTLDSKGLDKKSPKKHNREKKVFINEEAVKWPNRKIPFKINYGSYNNGTNITHVMTLAVSRFNDAGCVQWVPHTHEPYHVEINGNKTTCMATAGFHKLKVHPMWMFEYTCVKVGTALHEMMHVAGAMHRQSRGVDRHKVLSFNWADIPKYSEFNYAGFDLTNAREYDLGSVLQYILRIGPKTHMYLNDPDLKYLTEIDHNDLSFYDKAELNAFYKCADDCVNPPFCQNEGFVKQMRGVCSCECVEGLTGPDCTHVNTSAGCGGTINLIAGASESIDMIGYRTGMTCTWLIKGPKKTKIQVYINSLGLPKSILGNCYHYIEIRDYLSGAKGKQICGNSGGATFTKKNIGPTNMMIVRFNSDRYSIVPPDNGFKLTVTASPSACSSSPCKYPSTCEDGAYINDYTCSCTDGYSGINCDTVAANATVTDSFERDFTTLMTHGSSGVDFKWSTNKYWDLNGVDITAFDGYLMATLRNFTFAAFFPYGNVAKLETTAIFERGNRCLRFNYALDDNAGGPYNTTLTVRIFSDSGTTNVLFANTSGNNWTTAELDLPAVNNMKIEFKGVYGFQHLVLDNIHITPLLCHEVNPCNDVVCQNGAKCELVVNRSLNASFWCNCQFGFSGKYCEKYVCTENSCINGMCYPVSSSVYKCECDAGWRGDKCGIDTCANVNCNQGSCKALSETKTQCNCDKGWYGELCDINPCENVNCNNGFCEVVSLNEVRCVCSYGWVGIVCDLRLSNPGRNG